MTEEAQPAIKNDSFLHCRRKDSLVSDPVFSYSWAKVCSNWKVKQGNVWSTFVSTFPCRCQKGARDMRWKVSLASPSTLDFNCWSGNEKRHCSIIIDTEKGSSPLCRTFYVLLPVWRHWVIVNTFCCIATLHMNHSNIVHCTVKLHDRIFHRFLHPEAVCVCVCAPLSLFYLAFNKYLLSTMGKTGPLSAPEFPLY